MLRPLVLALAVALAPLPAQARERLPIIDMHLHTGIVGGIRSPSGEDAIMKQTIAVLERRNIIGVLSGRPAEVLRWREAAPDRFIPSVQFNAARFLQLSDEVIARHHGK